VGGHYVKQVYPGHVHVGNEGLGSTAQIKHVFLAGIEVGLSGWTRHHALESKKKAAWWFGAGLWG